VWEGSDHVLKLLLDVNANIEVIDVIKRMPFNIAIDHRNITAMNILMNVNINAKIVYGHTPLRSAIQREIFPTLKEEEIEGDFPGH
jgi:ankyrin repeat protein